MKKELLFADAACIAPAAGNKAAAIIASRAALRPGKLRLLFLALSMLIIAQSPGRANSRPLLLHPVSKSYKQSLTDVTLLISNSYYTDFDVLLYNTVTDESFLVNISPNAYETPVTVPEGNYEVVFWPNDMGRYHHYYSVACGNSGGGFGTYHFYNVNISSELYCNTIYIE